jgi:hypothetical protein
MTFGINPRDRGEQPPVWWGARAIYRGVRFPVDYVHDRQQTTPYDKSSIECKALWFWLDHYAKPALDAELKRLVVTPSEERDIVIESHGFKLIANPRRSYGYLYIGAWPTVTPIVMPPPMTVADIAMKKFREARGLDKAPVPIRTTIVNDEEFRGGRRARRR